jgi:hypothetical protein
MRNSLEETHKVTLSSRANVLDNENSESHGETHLAIQLLPCLIVIIMATLSFLGWVLRLLAPSSQRQHSPTWRDTSVGLTVLLGAWVVLSAIGSFALGRYIAGRRPQRQFWTPRRYYA